MKMSSTLRIVRGLNLGIQAAGIWLSVYAVVCLSGQRFDARYLGFGWQLIPWDILSTDPWRSLWYLHVQPPLWNATLGISAWMSPASDVVTLQIVMASFGAVLAGASAILAHRLGLGRRSAVIVAMVATLNPEVLKGAFEPTYELAVAALLVVLAAVMVGATNADQSVSMSHRRVIMVALLVTVIALTRSLYHPLWVGAIVGLVLWAYRRHLNWRIVLVAILIPVIGIGSWMGKNQVLYDRATLSSWFGMNLQRAVVPVLDLEDLEDLYARGEVSDIAMIGPFGNYGLYADVMEPCVPSYSHRSVAEPMRTTDEWSPNFNYECFLPVFDQAGQDAFVVIREHPKAWLEGRLWSLRTTFAVSSMPAESSSVVLRIMDDVFSVARLDYGGVLSTQGWGTPIYGQLEAPVEFGLILIPMYAVVIGYGLTRLTTVFRRRDSKLDGETSEADALSESIGSAERQALVLVVVSGTVLFTIVIGVVAELGEQARFRTMTDPLVIVVAASLVLPRLVSLLNSTRQKFRSQSV